MCRGHDVANCWSMNAWKFWVIEPPPQAGRPTRGAGSGSPFNARRTYRCLGEMETSKQMFGAVIATFLLLFTYVLGTLPRKWANSWFSGVTIFKSPTSWCLSCLPGWLQGNDGWSMRRCFVHEWIRTAKWPRMDDGPLGAANGISSWTQLDLSQNNGRSVGPAFDFDFESSLPNSGPCSPSQVKSSQPQRP